MIRPLRQRHRVMMLALSLTLPVTLVLGIALRPTIPIQHTPPPGLLPSSSQEECLVWERTDLWPTLLSRTQLRRTAGELYQLKLVFPHLLEPDVLVYWVPGTPSSEPGLPQRAELLGALTPGGALLWPGKASSVPGYLILYSLANHKILSSSQPIPLP